MAILCIGDSLTFGNVGYSYIHFLKGNGQIINRGVNGDTTRCAYKRLERIMEDQRYDKADTYIISIGTNDVLLPYLKSVSRLWKTQMDIRCRVMKCITDDKKFQSEYEKYLMILSERQKKVVLVGLPYIELKNYPHKTLKRRNKIIAELAGQYGVPYIDLYFLQQKMLSRPHVYSWKHRNLLQILDSVIMTIFPFTKDWFGRMRRLELTIDGVHFNSRSARILAKQIQRLV